MLSGIIGDGLKMSDDDTSNNSPKRDDDDAKKRASPDAPFVNYIHYDPELHWCRVCDVFPRTAKDLLNHMHNNDHRQVTQEHQLVETPWHKQSTDQELPSFKGAPVKRIPIKGNSNDIQ